MTARTERTRRRKRNFNPRFPRGKRLHDFPAGGHGEDFNPRFPRGKRLYNCCIHSTLSAFQSTLPAGEATGFFDMILLHRLISIHASRGGSDLHPLRRAMIVTCISIHASRGGSDIVLAFELIADSISIHASRGGSDFDENGVLRFTFKFQSTLPAGEATSSMSCTALPGEISIHASRGGSDQLHLKTTPWSGISIHASRGGSDDCLDLLRSIPDISIHASRGGSDGRTRCPAFRYGNFNPRFPRGKRLYAEKSGNSLAQFQSTLPAGEATDLSIILLPWRSFQSTLPAGEATVAIKHRLLNCQFQSTLPAGEATIDTTTGGENTMISIHASRGGSDPPAARPPAPRGYFNPRFPRGKRLRVTRSPTSSRQFQSTLPAGEATCTGQGFD